jgi:hypothetical protein
MFPANETRKLPPEAVELTEDEKLVLNLLKATPPWI